MKNLIILVLAVYLLTLIFQPEPPEDYNAIHGEPVIMYATDWCGYCKKMRKMFKSKGIRYREFNIESSTMAHQEFKSLGGRGVPLTLVNGTAVHGYNPQKVMSLLNQ